MPDALHKQVLVNWLGLDLHQALGCPDRAAEKSIKDYLVEEFLSLITSLSPEKRKAFLDLLKVSVEPPLRARQDGPPPEFLIRRE